MRSAPETFSDDRNARYNRRDILSGSLIALAALWALVATMAAPEQTQIILGCALGAAALATLPNLRWRGGFRPASRGAVFSFALLLTPALIASVGGLLQLTAAGAVGWLLLMAVVFGGPSYLLVGGPMAWRAILKGKDRLSDFVVTGFVANLAAAPLTMVAFWFGAGLRPDGEALATGALFAVFIHTFGLLFGPLFGLVFGLVHASFRRRSDAPPGAVGGPAHPLPLPRPTD